MINTKKWKIIKHICLYIILAATISLLLTNYFFSAFRIRGDSMNPILMDQERIIISRTAIKRGQIHRYDIVALYKPTNLHKSIIKRVIALPDETIEIANGVILINNKRLKPLYSNVATRKSHGLTDLKPIHLPKGYFFLLGDNTDISIDSRNFGPVHHSLVFGKAIFRYWPVSRLGSLK